MKPDGRSLETTGADDSTVVATIDEIDDRAHVVIADITRDGSWMTMPEAESLSLDDWR